MRFEYSAGGVVYKKDSTLMILVSKHSYHHGWVFPKGLMGDREDNEHQTREETAIREVKEETGVDAVVEKELTPVWYFYSWDNQKQDKKDLSKGSEKEQIKKTVYYFLMKEIGGDISIHDDEMEEVEWIRPEEVEKRLSYPSDKRVWREARELLLTSNF